MSPPTRQLSGKEPAEKSKFLQTCDRLSLFLKANNSNIRHLNFAKFEGAPPVEDRAKTVDLLNNIDDSCEKAANVLPQYVILDSSSCEVENKLAASSSNKPKTSQMTIFYGGQVLVLDDVPADRVRDLILMAKTGSHEKHVELKSKCGKNEGGGEGKDSDLPIARRASLHKFLAKRKDRATVRAPYQHSSGGSSSGNEHSFDLNM